MIAHTRPPLSSIVRLPFDTTDRRVIGIRPRHPAGFALELRRRPTPFARPPEGTDTSWLRVPLMRKKDMPF
jgi:hypothetical protein